MAACEKGNQWLNECSIEKTNLLSLNSFAIRKPTYFDKIQSVVAVSR